MKIPKKEWRQDLANKLKEIKEIQAPNYGYEGEELNFFRQRQKSFTEGYEHGFMECIEWINKRRTEMRPCRQEKDRGFFGVAVFMPKSSVNVGTLWRSAHILGAAIWPQ